MLSDKQEVNFILNGKSAKAETFPTYAMYSNIRTLRSRALFNYDILYNHSAALSKPIKRQSQCCTEISPCFAADYFLAVFYLNETTSPGYVRPPAEPLK